MTKFSMSAVKYLLVLIGIGLSGILTRQLAQGSMENVLNNPANLVSAASFDYVEIDSGIGGDVKLVGDIDGDSFPDLILGGIQNERLNWYRYPNWEKTIIHTPDVEFTTDGALGDVDGDGDLDIIVPDGNSGNNLRWFENPRPSGDPAVGTQWIEHTVGSIGSWGKDVYVADYDSNGRLDIATRHQNSAMIFFQTDDDVWSKMSFNGLNLGNEGMASGRVDSDGHEDLVLRGTWLKNPGGAAAQTSGNWIEYIIGPANSDFKALVVDLNQNGVTDILFSSSESTDQVNWWEPTTGDPTGSWTKHTILSSLERAHTIQVADMDLDGDNDVVLAQMHTSSAKEIFIMENLDGEATSWQKEVIDNTGLHNGVVADIGNDGDFDIFGANWTGNPPVKLYVNQLDPGGGTLDAWTYKQVTNSHQQTFGLNFGDVNGDGPVDIVSGRYWYQNPGGDMLGGWVQKALPAGMQAMLVQDVDGDAQFDIIAQQHEVTNLALYWLEATNAQGTVWNSVQIGTVPVASHNLGAQGYRTGQVVAGGLPEILISSGQGIYYFTIPASPGAGNWPKVQISSNPSDEGFALGDIDQDSLLDVAATTGNSRRVEWYKNPGTGAANWAAFHIGDFFEALFPDRTEVADINGDNRLDIIVTEENGEAAGAETYWWQAPVNPMNGGWTRHLVVTQATTNSMDTADMDSDGDTDIILGEHRGSERVTIWENDGSGNLTEHLVSSGLESHLGTQAVDLDNDGDLDLVSIAFDDWQFVHLWRNDASGGGPNPTPTPLPTATNTPLPTSTNTPLPTATNTPSPSPTNPPGPTNTPTVTPLPTSTNTPLPTTTNTPLPSVTNTPLPTATDTSDPRVTATDLPPVTNTPRVRITLTNTPPPAVTNTAVPSATASNPTVTPVATATVGCTPAPGVNRVTAGQQVLYLFNEGGGTSVVDSSGAGTPINLTIDNISAVSWPPDGGLVVNSPTIIQSNSAPTRLVNAVKDSDEITLEAWVIPNNLQQAGPAPIFTLSRNTSFRNFTMGQVLDAYEMRLRTTETTNNALPAIADPAGSATTDLTHIVLTRQTDGQVALYVDNDLVAAAFRGGDFASWDDRFKMALANELTGNQPWLGTFHLVSAYDRALDSAEVDQNFQAGPQPDQGSGGCVGFSAGSSNTAVDGESSSALSWLVGAISTLIMSGVGILGFQNIRLYKV